MRACVWMCVYGRYISVRVWLICVSVCVCVCVRRFLRFCSVRVSELCGVFLCGVCVFVFCVCVCLYV